MAYTPPVLSVLRASCLRALRDDGTTFVEDALDDMINEGLAELDRFMPVESQYLAVDPEIARVIPVPLDYVFAVERVLTTTVDSVDTIEQHSIPVLDTTVPGWRNGWDFFAGAVDLGPVWGSAVERQFAALADNQVLAIQISGYENRPFLSGDDNDDVPVTSTKEEFALRRFVTLTGFRQLEHDLSLFQQWLTQANNTDVSPTQMMNMRGQAESEWERLQRQLKRVRRPPMG